MLGISPRSAATSYAPQMSTAALLATPACARTAYPKANSNMMRSAATMRVPGLASSSSSFVASSPQLHSLTSYQPMGKIKKLRFLSCTANCGGLEAVAVPFTSSCLADLTA